MIYPERVEVYIEVLYLIRHPQKQQIWPVILVLCSQAFLWASPKWCQIMSQFHLKNVLRCKVVFLNIWVVFLQLCQLFHLIVVSHAQSYSKQLSHFSRMSWVMRVIFCMRLGIHKYIYLIQSIHTCVVRHACAFQKMFLILNLQYVKAEFFAIGIDIHWTNKLIQSFQVV